ncbi:RNA polymerase sigma factor [Bacillus sp. FJAT-45037]|uniref:RNA polymerase sigma factor n=1 Tax=Bacillus sp. FJAT-45037 TaxID=2011007 RepID=UPI001E590FC9|nr:RNA polymerase sigma factor [Bacillus sp. FJAT-45037]
MILKNDKQALEQLYDRYERILFSFIYRFTNDNGLTEEVMQDVFIKIWQKKAHYDSSKGKFSSWLLTIARNASIDQIRKRKLTEVEYDVRDSREDPHLVEDIVEQKEDQQIVQEALKKLPNDQAKIVRLFYFEGETQKTISERCGIPLGTVKGRIRLALGHLRKQLSRGNGRGDIYE